MPALSAVGLTTGAALKPDEPTGLMVTSTLLEYVSKNALSWMKKYHDPDDSQFGGAHEKVATEFRAEGFGKYTNAEE